MIELGLSKYDFALLLEKWEIQIVYPEETAKKVKGALEENAENLFLEKKGEPKTVRIQFYELGKGRICWLETFCNFQFTFQSYEVYKRQGILKLKVEVITDRGFSVNITPQGV